MRKGYKTIRAVSPHGAVAALAGDALYCTYCPARTHYNIREMGRPECLEYPLVGVIPVDWVLYFELNQ